MIKDNWISKDCCWDACCPLGWCLYSPVGQFYGWWKAACQTCCLLNWLIDCFTAPTWWQHDYQQDLRHGLQLADPNIFWNSSHYKLTWLVRNSTIFQRPLTVPCHIPNGRHLPAIRVVQGDGKTVYLAASLPACTTHHQQTPWEHSGPTSLVLCALRGTSNNHVSLVKTSDNQQP